MSRGPGEPYAIAPRAVRERKRGAGLRQHVSLRLEKRVRGGAENIIRHCKALLPALVFAVRQHVTVRQTYSSGASTIGSYRLISRPSKFHLCPMWGGPRAVTPITPPPGRPPATR